MKNPYQILGISETATDVEIKAAYKTLAKEFHPDKQGDNEKMASINWAYETLTKPEKFEQWKNAKQIKSKQIIENLLFQVVENCDPEHTNILNHLEIQLSNGKNSLLDAKHDAKNKLKKLNKTLSKIHSKKEDTIQQLLKQRIKLFEDNLLAFDEELEALQYCHENLKFYEWV